MWIEAGRSFEVDQEEGRARDSNRLRGTDSEEWAEVICLCEGYTLRVRTLGRGKGDDQGGVGK